jgi:hypothetical protein
MSQIDIPGDFKDEVRDENKNDATRSSNPGPAGPVLRLDAGRNRPKPAPKATTDSLTTGLSDEDLWMLIRRFNKVSHY